MWLLCYPNCLPQSFSVSSSISAFSHSSKTQRDTHTHAHNFHAFTAGDIGIIYVIPKSQNLSCVCVCILFHFSLFPLFLLFFISFKQKREKERREQKEGGLCRSQYSLQVRSVDVTAFGDLAVSSSDNGQLLVWKTNTGEIHVPPSLWNIITIHTKKCSAFSALWVAVGEWWKKTVFVHGWVSEERN